MEEKELSQQESLQLITQMIQRAKKGVHERGTSAILWGSAVAVCGLTTFAQLYWKFNIGFDIWLLMLAAFIPQAFISIRESRERKVVSHTEVAMNAVWFVYAISIFGLIFYLNTANSRVPHVNALFLLLYAIPTLSGGLAYKFPPMIVGAIICYGLFVGSIYVDTTWSYLLHGLAGIFNWLIPGLILRQRYLREKRAAHV